MLVNRLSLKDFKCFEEVDIEFGKITLLTGANSSGKSSLIYALLGIMQSRPFPEFFALNGKLVNMGGFEDVIRKKSEAKYFEINITIGEKRCFARWNQNDFNEQPELVECIYQEKDFIKKIVVEKDGNLIITLRIEKGKLNKIQDIGRGSISKSFLRKFKYQALNISITDSEVEVINKNNFNILSENADYIELQYIISRLNILSSFSLFPLPIFVGHEFLGFNYIGSFRLPPERTYYSKPNASLIGVNGEGYIDQIISWEEHDRELLDNLIYEIKELGLLSHIETNRMKGGRFEVNVKTNKNSSFASLTDVGFGISQFLPIIVADFQLNEASCLAVSQPEIHLHPKIQATLGEYFARQIKKTEKQYIVETHSEYLINRLRLLIVKGELNPEDVKLYYMENDGDKTTTYKIELTTDGQIKNAPQGFFDTYEMDVMDIALFASAQ